MMRARNQGMYLSVSSYSAVALLARKRLLDFCRVVHVVRNGQIVKRMIHAPDVTQDERRGPRVYGATSVELSVGGLRIREYVELNAREPEKRS